MVALYWFWPMRDRPHEAAGHDEEQWQPYRKAAADAGFELEVIDGDDVTIRSLGTSVEVYVKGKLVTPDTTAFHTKLLSWPDYEKDIWRFLSTFAVLDAAGFYTTIPVHLSVVDDDKLLTLLQPWTAGIPTLPTWRLLTRHFVSLADFIDPALIEYPVLVKPSGWGGGMGVLRADNRQTLEAALQLAAAAEIPMVIQPWVTGEPVDCRVVCIDGEPVRAIVRSAVGQKFAANQFQGGRINTGDVPDFLAGPARQVAAGIGLPFVCVDFLVTSDDHFYLSEVEMDGSIDSHIPGQAELVGLRFKSLMRHFQSANRSPRGLRPGEKHGIAD